MLNRTVFVMVILAGLGQTASAAPDDQDYLQVRASQRACPLRGGLCLRAGAPTTVADGSLPTASLRLEAPTPVFERSARATAWTIELDANLRRSARAGNSLFLIYDAEDFQAIAWREVTALYQAPIASGRAVSATLVLDENDGFRAGHTYLIRIAQLINGAEVILAEGEARLR